MPPTTSPSALPVSAANRPPATDSSATSAPPRPAGAPGARFWLEVALFGLLAFQAGFMVGGNAARFGAGLPVDGWSLALTALSVLLALGIGAQVRQRVRALVATPR